MLASLMYIQQACGSVEYDTQVGSRKPRFYSLFTPTDRQAQRTSHQQGFFSFLIQQPEKVQTKALETKALSST